MRKIAQAMEQRIREGYFSSPFKLVSSIAKENRLMDLD